MSSKVHILVLVCPYGKNTFVTLSSKMYTLVSVCLQWCIYLCQYVFKSSHLGVSMSSMVHILVSVCFKSAYLGVTMSSKVHILVSVCLQWCIYLCQYVFKSTHFGVTIISKKHILVSLWPHLSVSMSSIVLIMVSLCSQKYTS